MKDSLFRHNHSTTHALSAIGTLLKKFDKLMTSGLEKLFLLGIFLDLQRRLLCFDILMVIYLLKS